MGLHEVVLLRFLAFFALLLCFSPVFAMQSITISSEDYNLVMEKGKTYYFSFRIYNEGDELTKYNIRIKADSLNIGDVVDYKWETEEFSLMPGENKPIMLEMVPKISAGQNVFRITASTVPVPRDSNESGVKIVLTAEKQIVASFSDVVSTEKYEEKPAWKQGEETEAAKQSQIVFNDSVAVFGGILLVFAVILVGVWFRERR